MKRLLDLSMALFGLILSSPLLAIVMLLVWNQDRHSPIYWARRVGKNGRVFYMVKLRSMVVNADQTGVDSTSASDMRITPIGRIIRRYKLDEMTQLWNVLVGDMSLVGPRPNVERETKLYSTEEQKLLSVLPGITDFASIVFSDEGEILRDKIDPDLAYHQLIRPGKSALGLFYVENRSLLVDIELIFYTCVSIGSRATALSLLCKMLERLNCPDDLRTLSTRANPLIPSAPPGLKNVVESRDVVL